MSFNELAPFKYSNYGLPDHVCHSASFLNGERDSEYFMVGEVPVQPSLVRKASRNSGE